MKWVWLFGTYIPAICFVGYFVFAHLFKSGPTTVSHVEMFWLCMIAFNSAQKSLFEFVKEHWL